MLPVAELRVGLPAGIAMGLPIQLAFLASVLGSMIPVPFVILFIRSVFKWVRTNVPKFSALIDRIETRAYEKIKRKNLTRLKAWGLLLFVAVPLPGTGAWMGSLIAALLDLRLKSAVPAIFLGTLIAALLTTLATYGVTSLFF